jgi:hypothetical protein
MGFTSKQVLVSGSPTVKLRIYISDTNTLNVENRSVLLRRAKKRLRQGAVRSDDRILLLIVGIMLVRWETA